MDQTLDHYIQKGAGVEEAQPGLKGNQRRSNFNKWHSHSSALFLPRNHIDIQPTFHQTSADIDMQKPS